MDETNEIKNNIKEYIKDKYSINEENISIKIEQIDGMTNKNFHISFFNTNEPNQVYEILYRKYGKVLDSSDHDSEIFIMEFLANKKEGPKILYKSANYRIVEYIQNSTIIPLELRYDRKILNDINVILSHYSNISNIYKYSISSDLKIEFTKYNTDEKYKFLSIFDIYDKMLIKAKEKYNTFNIKFKEYFSKNEIPENIKNMKNKYDYYMN
jgi:hypothetical protein